MLGRSIARALVAAGVALLLLGTSATIADDAVHGWSPEERRTLRSLSLATLGEPPPDPSNAVADDPRAAALGRELFFDRRLSANGEISCATCHDPRREFTDGRGRARGLGITARGAPTLVGVAWSPWLYWDGRRDSLWAQALAPIEAPDEMGLPRERALRVIADDPLLREPFEALFGPLPALDEGRDPRAIDRAFAGLGKALAAFQRTLHPAPSRFDRYVAWLDLPPHERPAAPLDAEEIAGLRLFISPDSQCTRCHNGPLFTNHGFHNVAAPRVPGEPPDFGRLVAIDEVLADEFNCLGPHSDADPERCLELRFVKRDGEELPGAFKVPTLRSVTRTAPYFHAGQFPTLRDVLRHYARPEPSIGHTEILPTSFDDTAIRRLERFLATLESEPDDPGVAPAERRPYVRSSPNRPIDPHRGTRP